MIILPLCKLVDEILENYSTFQPSTQLTKKLVSITPQKLQNITDKYKRQKREMDEVKVKVKGKALIIVEVYLPFPAS